MNNSLMFSSQNQKWATRPEVFESIQEQLGREYNLDPCCEVETAKCKNFITSSQDMFTVDDPFSQVDFGDSVEFYANPEYGRAQIDFVKHFVGWCKLDGVVGDVLLPARPDTNLFHNIILPNATTIRFVEGRITFGDDAYWEWVWGQEYLPDGKKNSLYKKYGKMNAAPFPSMLVSFGENKLLSWDTIKLAKAVYGGEK